MYGCKTPYSIKEDNYVICSNICNVGSILNSVYSGVACLLTQVPTIASAGVIALLPIIGGYFGGIIFILCTVVTVIVSYYNYKAVYSKMSNISDSNLFAILASVISLCRIIFVFSHKNDVFVEDGEYVEE